MKCTCPVQESSYPTHHTMPGLLDTKGFHFYSLKFAIAVMAEMLGVLMFAFYSTSAPSEYAAWANGLSLAFAGRAGYLSVVTQTTREAPVSEVPKHSIPCSLYNSQHQRWSSQPSHHSGHSVHRPHLPPQSRGIYSCAECWCRVGSPHPGKPAVRLPQDEPYHRGSRACSVMSLREAQGFHHQNAKRPLGGTQLCQDGTPCVMHFAVWAGARCQYWKPCWSKRRLLS